MNRFKNMTTAAGIMYIIFGLLCIILQSRILLFAAIAIGIVFIVFGIINILMMMIPFGVLLLVLGILIILAGWLMIAVLFFVIAIAMIIIGIQRLVRFNRTKALNDSMLCPECIRAVLLIVIGVLLFFFQKGTVSAMFIIAGILMIIAGIMAIADKNRI